MNADETKAAAAIMLAHAEGRAIEGRWKDQKTWHVIQNPTWDFEYAEYRVKSEPWSGKIWLHADGHTVSYCKSDPEEFNMKFMLKNGYRLIEVKEVMP